MKYTRVLFVLGPVVGIMATGHLCWLAEVLGNTAGDSLGVECVNETSHLAASMRPVCTPLFPRGEVCLSAYHKGHGSPGRHDGRLLHNHSAPGPTGYAGPGNVQPIEMNVGIPTVGAAAGLKSPLTAQLKRRIV